VNDIKNWSTEAKEQNRETTVRRVCEELRKSGLLSKKGEKKRQSECDRAKCYGGGYARLGGPFWSGVNGKHEKIDGNKTGKRHETNSNNLRKMVAGNYEKTKYKKVIEEGGAT